MPLRTTFHNTTFLMVVLLLLLLVCVRVFEKQLFYDPFLHYFEEDYLSKPLPDYKAVPFFSSLFLRFALNSLLSLGIIFALFKDRGLIGFVAILYLLLFVLLLFSFIGVLYFFGNQQNSLLFYVRRFLIQPLFLLLFVPAFYYQKLKN